jgi:predicted TIM-barrel fold metal-dependent hydrolase
MKMKIIDAHMHLGSCRIFDVAITKEELMNSMKQNNITASIVQPFPGAPDIKKIHHEIARLALENPGKIFGMASLNPHQDDDAYLDELDMLVKDNKFVGVKLHTIGHSINPLSKDATKVFEAAKKLRIPVMVHTGPGIPFSLPSLIIPRAKQYPDVNIILAHAGNGMVISDEIIPTVLAFENIYIETSWSSILEKQIFLRTLGADKIIFGSDLPINTSTELYQYKTLGLSEEEMDKILYKNANKLFKLGL